MAAEHGPVPRSDADYCAAMLQQLEQVSDRRLGSEGPSLLQRTKVQALALLAQDESSNAGACTRNNDYWNASVWRRTDTQPPAGAGRTAPCGGIFSSG
jgi:hypothetical protein